MCNIITLIFNIFSPQFLILMKKNNNNNAKNTVSSTVKINVEKKAVVQTSEYLSVIFTTLYLLVHFVTDWGGADVMGSQWLYTGTLDFFILGYIILNANQYKAAIENIFKIIRVDALWRMTHLERPNTKPFGVRVSLSFRF